jgi:hypothetical protein
MKLRHNAGTIELENLKNGFARNLERKLKGNSN